jgi:hypothetical protein
MCSRSVFLAAMLAIAPFGAKSADLVVWWEKGFYSQEDEALEEIIAAFEQETGKQVELALHEPAEAPEKVQTALEAGKPPDFAFNLRIDPYFMHWALDDRLVDLTDAVGHFSDLFDPDGLARVRLPNPETGQKALYGLPIGRSTNYLHVWKNLLEKAGFTREDIPKNWDAFWSFWCDQVQPAVRRATNRDDIWGIALNMSGEAPGETHYFVSAMASYVGLDPAKDIDWITSSSPKPIQLFADGQADAFLAFPPAPQELRARKIGRVILNTGLDRPWSQYFCCVLVGNADFVRDHPVATKRATRAILKAADLCLAEPKRAAQQLVDRGLTERYDYARSTLEDVPYGTWREYDPEDAVRFFALRLHEAGFIEATPHKIIAEGTDWRFLNEIKRELKA